jgi:hypothetical protein
VAERKESKARLPISPYVLICLEAAANVDFRSFRSREPGCPGLWRAGRYDGMACDDGPSPMSNLSSHVRIQVEVVQRLLRCRNPAMVVELARSWYVAAVLASGRGADASGMSVKEFRAATPPKSGWEPRLPPDQLYPPLQFDSRGGGSIPSIRMWIDIDKSGLLDTEVWVPVMSLLGPQKVHWAEEWAASRMGHEFIIPRVAPPKRQYPLEHPPLPFDEGPEDWVGATQIARAK